MKVAVIGSGGREHAIIWKLEQDMDSADIYAIPGNGGTANNIPIKEGDFKAIHQFCQEKGVELVIVGPEAPLAAGIIDYFADSGIRVFGPDKKAAQLEGSKIFAKNFMKSYAVATADFTSYHDGQGYEEEIRRLDGKLVIKYDGLAGGKGVFVTSSQEEALSAVGDIKSKYGNDAPFIIEEKLSGQEISIIGFTDGRNIQMLLPSQDHKPALDGDNGPNTGGMGAYCPVPLCDDALLNSINESVVIPTLNGIREEKFNYKGVIYFGLMITDDGPKLLEYNVRLGDPEAEVILPSMKSMLLPLINACFDGNLEKHEIQFNPGYYVDVVLTSKGYPADYETGFEISGLDNIPRNSIVFHSGTKKEGDKTITSGGRVLNVVSTAPMLKDAIDQAYNALNNIHFNGMIYRSDIGNKGLQ